MKKRDAATGIYLQLRHEILSGTLVAASQLKQEEIASRFGSSRTPVREALRQLAAEDLVVLTAGYGSVVSTLSLDDLHDFLDIRLALETRALRLAIPNMIETDIQKAKEILNMYDGSLGAAEWFHLNWMFHATLYAPANRPLLLNLIEQTVENTARYFMKKETAKMERLNAQDQCTGILTACQNSRIETAVDLLSRYILDIQKTVAAGNRNWSLNR